MILIADSGATRAEWVIIKGDYKSRIFETTGFNPYYSDSGFIEQIIEKDLVPFINTTNIDEIYFYGAGCSTISKCTVVEDALTKVFHSTHIEIHHDLIGAARSLFGRGHGIACILGTGSNSCYYDGISVIENRPSLGYLFGDEGSGAYLGKLFLQDYLRGTLPNNLLKNFEEEYSLVLENILDAVYNRPYPNKFLASFATFIGRHQRSNYIKELLKKNFADFFREQITIYGKYKEIPIGVIGSIGYHFSDQFKKVARDFGITDIKFVQSPIDGLVAYHSLEASNH